ncbi:hypothetical protein JCM10213_004711 [Rhodosporidiobolus nylandii]
MSCTDIFEDDEELSLACEKEQGKLQQRRAAVCEAGLPNGGARSSFAPSRRRSALLSVALFVVTLLLLYLVWPPSPSQPSVRHLPVYDDTPPPPPFAELEPRHLQAIEVEGSPNAKLDNLLPFSSPSSSTSPSPAPPATPAGSNEQFVLAETTGGGEGSGFARLRRPQR